MTSESSFLPRRVRENVSGRQRRRVLDDLEILDTPADPDFDRLTRLAAGLFHAPLSAVALVDDQREWFKSKFGLDAAEQPLGFTAQLTTTQEPHLVVLGDASFYAGAIITVDGERLGAL